MARAAQWVAGTIDNENTIANDWLIDAWNLTVIQLVAADSRYLSFFSMIEAQFIYLCDSTSFQFSLTSTTGLYEFSFAFNPLSLLSIA